MTIDKHEELVPGNGQYGEPLERARKLSPALIKRLSNTIPAEQKGLLIDPDGNDFVPDFGYPNLFDMNEEEIAEKKVAIADDLSILDGIEAQGYRPSLEEQFDKQKANTGISN